MTGPHFKCDLIDSKAETSHFTLVRATVCMLPSSFSSPSSWDARELSAKSCPVLFFFPPFCFYFCLSDTCKQLAAAQPSELPTLAGSSGAGCTCCSGRKDVAHSFSKLRWDLNHIATVGRKEPFHIRVQLSRKRRKKTKLDFTQHLKFWLFRSRRK